MSAKDRLAQLRLETGLMQDGSVTDQDHAPSAEPAGAPAPSVETLPPASAPAPAAERKRQHCLKEAYDWIVEWLDSLLSSSICLWLIVGTAILAGFRVALLYVTSHAEEGSLLIPEGVGPIGLFNFAMDAMFAWAEQHPLYYLSLNFGIAFAVGTFFLFLKDMTDWWTARQQAARQDAQRRTQSSGYQRLPDIEEGIKLNDGGKNSPEELAKELSRVTDQAEELEIKVRVYKKSTSDQAAEVRARLKVLQTRRDELRSILHGTSSSSEVDGKAGEKKSGSSSSNSSSSSQQPLVTRILGSVICQVLARSANGVLVVGLYFADIFSDIQVIQLLWGTGNYLWFACSVSLLMIQFGVVFFRVLPYLRSTFGRDDPIYIAFIFLGFPSGLLFLDLLMFLEPFGLLTVLPLPDWLRQFVPAYKATRIIAEVLIESLPQCLLQAYIYIVVLWSVEAGTATPSQEAMVEFLSALPNSILISTLATEKTWIELVHGARQAGLTVIAKGIQLWNVGAGLPLDALKKGAIVEWTCSYELDESEVRISSVLQSG